MYSENSLLGVMVTLIVTSVAYYFANTKGKRAASKNATYQGFDILISNMQKELERKEHEISTRDTLIDKLKDEKDTYREQVNELKQERTELRSEVKTLRSTIELMETEQAKQLIPRQTSPNKGK